jgi:hypothetical protein
MQVVDLVLLQASQYGIPHRSIGSFEKEFNQRFVAILKRQIENVEVSLLVRDRRPESS